MREELNRHCKCTCKARCVEQWAVVREQKGSCVILCSGCGQAWHTAAHYAEELPRAIVSPYRWRQILHSPGYHAREETMPYPEPSESR